MGARSPFRREASGGSPGGTYDVVILRRNDFTVDGRVERQAESLGAAGFRVLVLALGGGRLPRRERREGYDLRRVAVDVVPDLGLRGLGDRIGRRARALGATGTYYGLAAGTIAAVQPRFVHCHDLDTLVPGIAGARWVGAKVIYDSAELWTERNHGLVGWRAAVDGIKTRGLERALIGQPDAVITVSDGIADELATRYGVPRPVVLRNVPRRPTLGDSPLREAVGARGPILLHLGVVDIHRGLENVVRALPRFPEATLALLGPARPYALDPLMALARRLGVEDRVVHLPPVAREAIISWASGADLGICLFEPVCQSHVMALPNKIFEYAFANLPILASDLPDMAALVRRERLGVVCDPESPSSVELGIHRLLGSQPARRTEAEAERFRERFCWEREQDKLLELYGRA